MLKWSLSLRISGNISRNFYRALAALIGGIAVMALRDLHLLTIHLK